MNPELYLRMAEVERLHWWYAGRKAIIGDRLRLLQLPANAEILDVGCGTGALTESLTCFGSVVGCDPSDLAVSGIKQGPRLRTMKPEELCGQPGWVRRFDLLGFFDVLEHAASDLALLQDYLPSLKEDGVVMITVPAWNCFWGHHDIAAHHYRRYRLSTLVKVCESAGLRLEGSTYFNLLLAPLVMATRAVQRLGSQKGNCGDLALPPRAINDVLKQVFLLERQLLRRCRLAFGVSLLATFRRVPLPL